MVPGNRFRMLLLMTRPFSHLPEFRFGLSKSTAGYGLRSGIPAPPNADEKRDSDMMRH
jgi:hypothetical protein